MSEQSHGRDASDDLPNSHGHRAAAVCARRRCLENRAGPEDDVGIGAKQFGL